MKSNLLLPAKHFYWIAATSDSHCACQSTILSLRRTLMRFAIAMTECGDRNARTQRVKAELLANFDGFYVGFFAGSIDFV